MILFCFLASKHSHRDNSNVIHEGVVDGEAGSTEMCFHKVKVVRQSCWPTVCGCNLINPLKKYPFHIKECYLRQQLPVYLTALPVFERSNKKLYITARPTMLKIMLVWFRFLDIYHLKFQTAIAFHWFLYCINCHFYIVSQLAESWKFCSPSQWPSSLHWLFSKLHYCCVIMLCSDFSNKSSQIYQ